MNIIFGSVICLSETLWILFFFQFDFSEAKKKSTNYWLSAKHQVLYGTQKELCKNCKNEQIQSNFWEFLIFVSDLRNRKKTSRNQTSHGCDHLFILKVRSRNVWIHAPYHRSHTCAHEDIRLLLLLFECLQWIFPCMRERDWERENRAT